MMTKRMATVRLTSWTGLILLLSVALAPAHAADLRFRGLFQDGLLAGQTVRGRCELDPTGDPFHQRSMCRVTVDGVTARQFKLLDPQANIDIVGDQRTLRIILGVSLPSTSRKGNHKISVFQTTTFYHDPINLLRPLPPTFATVAVTLAGVSAAGSGENTIDDCIIWDISGSE